MLPYRTLHWTATATGPLQPSGGWSSDLRSGVGAALAGGPDFHRLFEPFMSDREPPRGLAGSKDAPRPLIFFGPYPSRLPAAGTVRFGLTTFMTDDRAAHRLAQAMAVACHVGLGDPRRRLHLDEEDLGSVAVVGVEARRRWQELGGGDSLVLRLRFHTPVHLRQDKRLAEPTFRRLVGSLMRRLDHLRWMFVDGPLEFDPQLLDLADAVDRAPETSRSLRRFTGDRKSKRQRAIVPMEGYRGWMEGVVPREVGLVLLAGEIVHAGKDTVQGLGRIGIEAA